MNMALIFKEVRENKWAIIIDFIMLAVITLIYPYSYGSMLTYLLAQGITYEKFIWYDWFLKAQPQIVIIVAIIMGSSVMAKEKKNSTLGILVTKPVSRAKIIINKLFAGSIALVAIMTAATFILTLISPMLGAQGMQTNTLLLGLFGDILLVIPAYLMSAALSVVFMNSIKAGLAATGIFIILYGPAWAGSKFSIVWWLLGSFGVLSPSCSAVLVAVGALSIWLGAVLFNKAEI